MSRAAYQARLHNLRRVKKRPRMYEQTRRIELEIALGTHRGESYRAMARWLGCSHVHSWRVARRYRAGLIPLLPPDEQGLLALRDSLDTPAPPRPSDESEIAPPHEAPPEPQRHLYEVEGGESRWMTAQEHIAEQIAANWRRAREEQRKNPCSAGRRTMSSVPPWLPRPILLPQNRARLAS